MYKFKSIFAVILTNIMLYPLSIFGEIKFSDRVEEYFLPNDMKVILIEDKRSPSVVSSVWYKVGSSYEYPGLTGISHILEHMMFKGTSTTEAGEFSKVIKQLGGSENAFTGRDFTGYYQKVHKDYLETCLKYESDRMTNLMIKEEDLKTEREVVKEERRLRTEDNPASKAYEKIGLQMYGLQKYGIPIIGTMDDISKINTDDLRSWYRKYYHPSNATLIIAGDFNLLDTKKLIQKYFGSIQNKPEDKNIKKISHKKSYEDIIIPNLKKFSPDIIFISAGFDAHKDDPLADFRLTKDDFYWITKVLNNFATKHCKGKLISCLEGGYNIKALSESCLEHVKGLIL